MTAYEETEVRRARRSWPVQYKLDILAEIDEAKMRGEPGAVGTICRREGLYSSLISRWRQQRDEGARKGLVERPTGPRAPSRLSLERDRYRQRAMVSSPARKRFARFRASRRSVLTRSPGFVGISAGAMTRQSIPFASRVRFSRNPVGPAS